MFDQPACKFVGLVNSLSPLRTQAEVEPWTCLRFVAWAIIAFAFSNIDHFYNIALVVVVPNHCVYGRTPTVSEPCARLCGGVAFYS